MQQSVFNIKYNEGVPYIAFDDDEELQQISPQKTSYLARSQEIKKTHHGDDCLDNHQLNNSAILEKESFSLKRKILLLKIASMGLDTTKAQQYIEANPANFQNMQIKEFIVDLSEFLIQKRQTFNKIHLNQAPREQSFQQILYSISPKNINNDDFNINTKISFKPHQKYCQQEQVGSSISSLPLSSPIFEVECQICLGSYKNQEIYKLSCCHEFCKYCIQQYLQYQILIGNVQEIPCPDDYCTEKCSEYDIFNNTDDQLQQKYRKFLRRKILVHSVNTMLCKVPDCEGYVEKIGNSKTNSCNDCQQVYCTTCENFEHKNKHCMQIVDEEMAKAKSQFQIQDCPQCYAPIQKSSGCNHITCQKCYFDFCWICREEYVSGHYNLYNVFKCGGRQFSAEKPIQNQYLRYICRILENLLFFVLCPLISLFIGIFIPYIMVEKNVLRGEELNFNQFTRKFGIFKGILIITVLMLIGIISLPIQAIFITIGGILTPGIFVFQHSGIRNKIKKAIVSLIAIIIFLPFVPILLYTAGFWLSKVFLLSVLLPRLQ